MSSIEERLVRDIEDVTKGVIVTEPELLEARSELDEHIESTRRRDRRRTVLVVAAAAVVIAGAGVIAVQSGGESEPVEPAGQPTPDSIADTYDYWLTGGAPTAQLIDGLWRLDNGGMSLLFSEDGTVQIDEQGMVYSKPAAWGTYQIDGVTINMTFDGGTSCEGTQQAMVASLMKDGTMRAVADDASGGNCTPFASGQMAWEHVLPPARALTGLAFSHETGWQPLPTQFNLAGDWAAEGGGYVLEMTPNGDYFLLDESAEAIDEGEWSRQGPALVLTSSARSTNCDNGDRLVLGNVETVDAGTLVIRGTVGENTCGGSWTPKTWFLIPHVGADN